MQGAESSSPINLLISILVIVGLIGGMFGVKYLLGVSVAKLRSRKAKVKKSDSCCSH